MVEVKTAAIAEVFVVIKMWKTSEGFWKLIVEPGLNPNHPSHNTKSPMTASDMLCPGMARGLPSRPYFPIRGPNNMGTGQGGPTTDGVHGCISSKIFESQISEPTAAPDPVPYHRIDDKCEDKGKNDERNVFYTFCHSTRYDRGCRAAENQLEEEFSPKWHCRCQRLIIKRKILIAQNKQMLSSDHRIVTTEHQSPAEQQKSQRGNGKNNEVFRQDVDGIFGPCESRFHAGKSQIHKEYQNCREKDP